MRPEEKTRDRTHALVVLRAVQLKYFIDNIRGNELGHGFLGVQASCRAQVSYQGAGNMIVSWIALQICGRNWPEKRTEKKWTPRIQNLQGCLLAAILFPASNATKKSADAMTFTISPDISIDNFGFNHQPSNICEAR